MFKWITRHQGEFLIPKFTVNTPAIQNALATVRHISKNYPPPYEIFASGGVDSQAVIYAWIASGKAFNVNCCVFNDQLNHHDYTTLIRLSEILNFDIVFHELDVLKFLSDEYPDYAETYKCGSPHVCAHMKMSEFVNNGTVIFSGDPGFGGQPYTPDANRMGLYRYAQQTGRDFVPFFFLETPEIAWGMGGINHANESKANKYQNRNFIVIEPESKFTGFEKVKDLYDSKYSHLVTDYDRNTRLSWQSSNRTFDLLLRNKYEFKYHSESTAVFRYTKDFQC